MTHRRTWQRSRGRTCWHENWLSREGNSWNKNVTCIFLLV